MCLHPIFLSLFKLLRCARLEVFRARFISFDMFESPHLHFLKESANFNLRRTHKAIPQLKFMLRRRKSLGSVEWNAMLEAITRTFREAWKFFSGFCEIARASRVVIMNFLVTLLQFRRGNCAGREWTDSSLLFKFSAQRSSNYLSTHFHKSKALQPRHYFASSQLMRQSFGSFYRRTRVTANKLDFYWLKRATSITLLLN